MSTAISIRPSKDLRNNYGKISELARINPVAITVNGREDTIVISHDEYIRQQEYISALEAKLKFYAHLAEGMDDIKLGRVQDAEEFFADLETELGALEV